MAGVAEHLPAGGHGQSPKRGRKGTQMNRNEIPGMGELDGYLNAMRTVAGMDGDTETVAAMDAVESAGARGLSPIAQVVAGDAARAQAAGRSMLSWQRDVIRRHEGEPAWLAQTVIDLRRAGLLPWG